MLSTIGEKCHDLAAEGSGREPVESFPPCYNEEDHKEAKRNQDADGIDQRFGSKNPQEHGEYADGHKKRKGQPGSQNENTGLAHHKAML